MNSIKKYFIPFAASMFLFAAVNLSAQDKKEDSWETKLKQIKGQVQKIVVSTENGATTFEGNEANKMFKKLKLASEKIIEIEVNGDETDKDGNNVFIVKIDSDQTDTHQLGENLVWVTESIKDSLNTAIEKNINVEVNNGKKIVTVKTTKDGKKKIKIYEGKDAEKYLEENDDNNFESKTDGNGDNFIIIKTCKSDSNNSNNTELKSKKIKVKIIKEDGNN